uniref:Uncharacterized protein n=1 Tax=Pipistrellus kuhlii TaxID=59472 RepID=A0A7J7VMX0_PIPKU|nr:hypothetical protein mPipKuh1_008398 [Pipistrellus kuhlii]
MVNYHVTLLLGRLTNYNGIRNQYEHSFIGIKLVFTPMNLYLLIWSCFLEMSFCVHQLTYSCFLFFFKSLLITVHFPILIMFLLFHHSFVQTNIIQIFHASPSFVLDETRSTHKEVVCFFFNQLIVLTTITIYLT